MTIGIELIGASGPNDPSTKRNEIYPFDTKNGNHAGLAVLTHPFIETEPSTTFFTNPTFGIAMNQNISFSGIPELIFDGGSGGTEWTGSAIAGAWNFADGGKVTITNANNGSAAIFEDAGTIDMSGFTAITGKVDLDTYIPANNTIVIQFGLAGVLAGNPINLNDYIDTGLFTEQSFVIPKGDLGITASIVDEMTITITRTGGARPDISFDDFQIEKVGDPAVFSVVVDREDRFHIYELTFAYAAALAGTFADGTMPALAYNKILSLSALANGFNIRRTKESKTLFNATIKTLGGHISAGAKPNTMWSDGTNTFVTLRVEFTLPLILTGKPGDSLTVQINDPMNGLLQFTASARGSLER